MIYTLQFLSSKVHFLLLACLSYPTYIVTSTDFLVICCNNIKSACICKSEPVLEDMTAGIFVQETFSFSSRFPFSWFILPRFPHGLGECIPFFGPDFYTRGIRFHAGIISQYLMIIWHHMKGTSSNVSHFWMSFVLLLLKFLPNSISLPLDSLAGQHQLRHSDGL